MSTTQDPRPPDFTHVITGVLCERPTCGHATDNHYEWVRQFDATTVGGCITCDMRSGPLPPGRCTGLLVLDSRTIPYRIPRAAP